MADGEARLRLRVPAGVKARFRVMAASLDLTEQDFFRLLVDRHDRSHFGGRAAELVAAGTGESAGRPHPDGEAT